MVATEEFLFPPHCTILTGKPGWISIWAGPLLLCCMEFLHFPDLEIRLTALIGELFA